MSLLHVVYTVCLIFFGAVMLLFPRDARSIPQSENYWLLGLFGVTHGVRDLFFEGSAANGSSGWAVQWIDSFMYAGSFLALMEFGRRGLLGLGASYSQRTSWLLARRFWPALGVATVLMIGVSPNPGYFIQLSSFLICLPAGLATATVFVLSRSSRDATNLTAVDRLSGAVAAVGIAGFALLEAVNPGHAASLLGIVNTPAPAAQSHDFFVVDLARIAFCTFAALAIAYRVRSQTQSAIGQGRRLSQELESRIEARTSELRDRNVALSIAQAALDSSMNAIAILGVDGVIRYVNKSFVAHWQLGDASEAVGRHSREFGASPAEIDDVIQHLQQFGRWEGVILAARPSGSSFRARVSSHCVYGGDGQTIALMASIEDLTHFEAAERAAQKDRDFAQLLIKSAPAIVLVISSEGRVTHVNPLFERLTGYKREEAVGKDWFQTFIPDRLQEAAKARFRSIHSEAEYEGYDIPIVTRHGDELETMWYSQVLRDETGLPDAFLCLGQDVTQQRTTARALTNANLDNALLLRLASRLAAVRSIEGIGPAVGETIAERLEYANAWILVGSDGLQYRRVSGYGPAQVVASTRDDLVRLDMTTDDHLREVASADLPVVVADMSTDPRTNKQRVALLDDRTCIYVPLLLGERRLGALGVGTFGAEGVRVPSACALSFLTSVASHVAAAVDRVAFTERLQLTERRLAEAQDIAKVGAWHFDVQEDQLHWTPEVFRILGLSHGTVKPTFRAFFSLVHPDDRALVKRTYRSSVQTRSPFHINHRVRTRAGVKWLEQRGAISIDEAGNHLRSAGTIQDVTDRFAVEAELRRHREQLEDLVRERTKELTDSTAQLREAWRLAKLGHWWIDVASGEAWWSDVVYQIIRRDRAVFPPTMANFYAGIPEADRPLVELAEADFHRTGHLSIDHRIVRGDGSIGWVHDEGAVEFDETGTAILMRGTTQDISDRKAAEETALAAKLEAERANAAKSEFLSRMSHELRTPLNAILGFTQVLEMQRLEDEQRDFVKEIRGAGGHLLDLINELLDLSRIETGQLAVELSAVSVKAVVEQSVRLTAPLALKTNVTVSSMVQAGATARADPVRMKQVLVNLLSNAIKYNRQGGAVRISLLYPNVSTVRIAIEDTGPGIEESKLCRLFRPFDRLGADVAGIDGTGIGLALSKQLAELMGGSLGVQS